MQLSYSTSRAAAVPGLLAGNKSDTFVVGHYVAGEELTPGRLVVLNDAGTLEHPQHTSFSRPVGIVCFSPANMQPAVPAAGFTYKAGDAVPVLRRGRIWCDVSSSSEPTALVEANVKSSSTVATDRGKLTTNATSSGTGVEIYDGGPLLFVEKASTTLWLCEVNYPGNATNDDARLDALEADAATANATVSIPLNSFTAADATPLTKFASAGTPTFGLNITDAESLSLRWNNDASPGSVACQVSMPEDLDDAAAVILEFLVSKSGATVGDATSLAITAFLLSPGDLDDADANAGGTTAALVGNATAKTTTLLTRTIAAADVPAGVQTMYFTVTPTAGTLGTDDLCLHSVRMRYTRKIQTS